MKKLVKNQENAQKLGIVSQIHQMQEETAELTVTLSKYLRSIGHGLPVNLTMDETRGMVLEELADVQVMVDQLLYLFNFPEDEFEYAYNYKVSRTAERMK